MASAAATAATTLASVMADLGYASGASEGATASVISALGGGPLGAGSVAGVLSLLARTAGGRLAPPSPASADALAARLGGLTLGSAPPTWDAAGVGAALRAASPSLDWPGAVAPSLDTPAFAVPDGPGYAALLTAWAAGAGAPLPGGALAGAPWAHAAGQSDALREALAAPAAGPHATFDGPRVDPPAGAPPPTAATAASTYLAPYTAVIGLARGGAVAAARAALGPLGRGNPALLAAGLLAAGAADSPLAADAGRALASAAASQRAGGAGAVADVARRAPAAARAALASLAASDPAAAPRALDALTAVAGGANDVASTLTGLPATGAVELALAAATAGTLDVEAWASARAAADGPPFVVAAATVAEAAASGAGGRPSAPADKVAALLRGAARGGGSAASSGDAAAALERARAAAAASSTDGAPPPSSPPAAAGAPFPPDVEAEVNASLQAVYAGTDTVDALLTRVAGWASGPPRDRVLAACVAHSLLDEFRFLAKYPDAELAATAALFGGLVSRSLLPDAPLALALRCMLDAVREPTDSKLAAFGAGALRAAVGQLHRFPKYCAQLASVQSLRVADPALAATVDRVVADAASGAAPPQPAEPALASSRDVAAGGGGPPRATSPARGAAGADGATPTAAAAATATRADPARAFSTLNAETLDAAAAAAADAYAVPPADVADRVSFVINNLSIANVRVKAPDVAAAVLPDHRDWFAHYLVSKRAAQEPNYHALYAQLVDAMGDRGLWAALTVATVTYTRALLASERAVTQSSERSLLKNLGSWLGRLTLARNKPLLARDLDLKAALLSAYSGGRMIAVLPFIHKVLDPCKESRVFRPTNPWVGGLLSLVAEIYAQDRLKLNLKFEIEMLFRELGLATDAVKPADLLRTVPRPPPASADFADVRAAAVGGPGARAGVLPDAATTSLDGALASAGAAAAAAGNDAAFAAAAAGAQGGAAAALGGLAERAGLRRLVPLAVDRAVAEVGAPVVERSASIAAVAAAELARKDFASDGDEGRLRAAAHLAASSLAGSLALVTCREPLRAALAAQLRGLLAQVPGLDAASVEHLAAVATADNAEAGCALIEKAAADKAARDVDERVAPALAARAKARAAGAAWPGDPAPLGGRPPPALPESLRPRRGGPAPAQARVYDEFARLPRARARRAARPRARRRGARPPPRLPPRPPPPAPAFAAPSADELAALAPGYAAWAARLDAAAAADASADFWALPSTADLVVAAAEAADLAAAREDVGLALARRVFVRMYDGPPSRAAAGACAAALACLRDRAVRRLAADVTAWWAAAPDDRRWRRDAGEALLRARLLQPAAVDGLLTKALASGRPGGAMEFAVHAVRQSLVADGVLCPADLPGTLDVLARVAERAPSGAAPLSALVAQARRGPARGLPPPPPLHRRPRRRRGRRPSRPQGGRRSRAGRVGGGVGRRALRPRARRGARALCAPPACLAPPTRLPPTEPPPPRARSGRWWTWRPLTAWRLTPQPARPPPRARPRRSTTALLIWSSAWPPPWCVEGAWLPPPPTLPPPSPPRNGLKRGPRACVLRWRARRRPS